MKIKRDKYPNDLVDSLGNGMMKVITDPRKCGKSYLLFHLFKDRLLSSGVDESHIVELRLDSIENAGYRRPDALYRYFAERRPADGKTVFFLIDEIQFVKSTPNPTVEGDTLTFYDTLNGFLGLDGVEIFVTGSNSKMLSSDIATEFRGGG